MGGDLGVAEGLGVGSATRLSELPRVRSQPGRVGDMSVLELGRRYVELFDSVNCSLTGLQAELRERHGVVIAAATGSAGAEEPIGRLWQSAREGDTLARVCARAGDST